MNRTVRNLVRLSLALGREDRELAILGEGNTSADAGGGTFWVKASGTRLGHIRPKDFLRVRMDAIFELAGRKGLDDVAVMAGLRAAIVGGAKAQPSTECFLHALCLTEGEAKFVGHTHPTAVMGILASRMGPRPFLGSIYPDEVVYCGKHVAVVPYVDPGIKLYAVLRGELRRFKKAHGYPPRTVLMVNHGMIALGKTADEVFNITMMAEKWARILASTCAFGGPNYFSGRDASHIDNWKAEHYRRRLLRGGAKALKEG